MSTNPTPNVTPTTKPTTLTAAEAVEQISALRDITATTGLRTERQQAEIIGQLDRAELIVVAKELRRIRAVERAAPALYGKR